MLTRTEARRRIRPEAVEQALRWVVFDQGRVRALVEEVPPAVYRDIAEVLEDEAQWVKPMLRFAPVSVLKG